MCPCRTRTYDETQGLTDYASLVWDVARVKPGMDVVRRSDKVIATVMEFREDQVILKVDGKACQVSVKSFLKGEWQVYAASQKGEEVIDDLAACNPLTSDQMQCSKWQTKLMQRMIDLLEKCTGYEDKLEVVLKPYRGLRATLDIPKGGKKSLQLVPASTRITVVSAAKQQAVPPGAVELGCFMQNQRGEDLYFYIMPMTTQPKGQERGFIAPWWFVQWSDDPEECNMEVKWNGDIIPVMQNCKVIEKGQTLRCLRTKPKPQKEVEEMVSLEEPVRKRQKKKG